MLVYSSSSLYKKVSFYMSSFTLYIKDGSIVTLFGYNMIDACLRSSENLNYKDVKGYKEGFNSMVVTFAK